MSCFKTKLYGIVLLMKCLTASRCTYGRGIHYPSVQPFIVYGIIISVAGNAAAMLYVNSIKLMPRVTKRYIPISSFTRSNSIFNDVSELGLLF